MTWLCNCETMRIVMQLERLTITFNATELSEDYEETSIEQIETAFVDTRR